MKSKIKLAVLVLGLTTLASCSRYIAPPFTDVSKVSQIKTGMKLKQISDILGIEPYDVFYLQETGGQLFSFNYRLKNRIMNVYNTVNHAEVSRQTSDENSQKAGELFYDKNYKTLYLLFSSTGDLTSYLTSSGANDEGRLILINNSIQFFDEKNTTLLDGTIEVGSDGKFNNNQKPRRRGLFKRIFNIY